MNKITELILYHGIIEKFCSMFTSEVRSIKSTLSTVNINVGRSLPLPFRDNSGIEAIAFYSTDKKQVFVNFKKSKRDSYSCNFVKGDIIQLFSFDGNKSMWSCSFTDCKIQIGTDTLLIDYALLLSYPVMIKAMETGREFTNDFIRSHWDYYSIHKKQNKFDYINYLEALRGRMLELFFDETVDELEIDKFLELNPIILESALNLYKPMHQIIMKNILGRYQHDLKPDLIAFDEAEKVWAIVDYKKAKRNIIKNLDKVRTGFKADVHGLKDQLRDYVEYFKEREQRECFSKEYKINIEFPKAIGVIGNISENEEIEFTRLIQDEPKWFNIVPYNYLFDNFCRYIDRAGQLLS